MKRYSKLIESFRLSDNFFYVYLRPDTNNCVVLCFWNFWQCFGPFLKEFINIAHVLQRNITIAITGVGETRSLHSSNSKDSSGPPVSENVESKGRLYILSYSLVCALCNFGKKWVLSVHMCNFYKEKILGGGGGAAYTVLSAVKFIIPSRTPIQYTRVQICKPFKEPKNRFTAWRNRFLGIDSWAS